MNGKKPGDFFHSMDEAAKDAAQYIAWLTSITGWEYATAFYKVERTVSYRYTREIQVERNGKTYIFKISHTTQRTFVYYSYGNFDTLRDYDGVNIPAAPNGYERAGMFHTHPWGSREGITQFSPQDISLTKDKNIPLYVLGPNGELRKLLPAFCDEDRNGELIDSNLPKSIIKWWEKIG